MRRNMDLIRAIALGRDTSEWTREEVGHHIYLMGQGGLAHVVDVTGYGASGLPQAALVCLTREGHDFADLANDEAWAWAKERVARAGGTAPFQVWVELLERWRELKMWPRIPPP